MSIPYCEFVYDRHQELVGVPEFRRLLQVAFTVLTACEAQLAGVAESLGDVAPETVAQLLSVNQRARPTALRLLTCLSDSQFYTDPHIEKSVLPAIVHTDDPCLFVPTPAAARSGEPLVSASFPCRRCSRAMRSCFSAPRSTRSGAVSSRRPTP